MNKLTSEKLKSGALAIEKFRALQEREQEWLYELLSVGKSALLALKILDAISACPLSFEEIADECGCNSQTVSQVLNALIEGGTTIQLDAKCAYAPSGRSRKLARR
ncbi:hypothetical protein [Iningainema tapete]|uniref:Uncharacterized protein n=1 Tax=Iningainema tapete BLCC-T55 TaxID=2748662 RepID=A0A8J6XI98_9CYAN|nr:hypothetical protein [Iningainema tapete]MBD2771216.1 hypothetical protein [Iningainema tapete BLCC-T55]